ncbi:hypothetical protein [Halopseudomonas sabulinigri]
MKGLLPGALLLLAVGSAQHSQARSMAQEVRLPHVQGWQITATRKIRSVTCSAQQSATDGQQLYLSVRALPDDGFAWNLQFTSSHRTLTADVQQATASLLVNGAPASTGSVVAIGDSAKRYVRFEFAPLAGSVAAIKPASTVELTAPGLAPLSITALAPLITALEQCQQDGLTPGFWNNATTLCN